MSNNVESLKELLDRNGTWHFVYYDIKEYIPLKEAPKHLIAGLGDDLIKKYGHSLYNYKVISANLNPKDFTCTVIVEKKK